MSTICWPTWNKLSRPSETALHCVLAAPQLTVDWLGFSWYARAMLTSRRLPLLLSAPLLLACPGTGGDAGEDQADDADTGSTLEGECFEPGSLLIDRARKVELPKPSQVSGMSCSEGWASDAPGREALWTTDLGDVQDNFAPSLLRAHPDGGVVHAGSGAIRRLSADGEVLWTREGPDQYSQYTMVVDADGSILATAWDWNSYTLSSYRIGDDGSDIGNLEIPLISEYATVWAMEWLGPDLILGCDDITMEGYEQPTLLRISALTGEELLRKSNPSVFGRPFAVNQSGTVLFGNPLVAGSNGAVLGTLTLSQGGPAAAVGVGDDFFLAGTDGDFLVARYSQYGNERWLQTYDRFGSSEQARAIAPTGDGGVVVVGLETSPPGDFYWYSSQPMVLAVDADGNALWRDRIASPGEANAVAVAADGSVYIAGIAELEPPGPGQASGLFTWIRKY